MILLTIIGHSDSLLPRSQPGLRVFLLRHARPGPHLPSAFTPRINFRFSSTKPACGLDPGLEGLGFGPGPPGATGRATIRGKAGQPSN